MLIATSAASPAAGDEQAGSHELSASGPAALTGADAEAWFDGFVPYALQSNQIAGAVVVVVKDDAVLMQKGYGFADVRRRIAVDPAATLFRPGSISKLFTWTAVMQLVEAGKLDLDADVRRYLDFQVPKAGGQPITLRNLMTHTAGFEEALKGLITDNPKQHLSLADGLKRWVPEQIYLPGTTPAYSNYAATLAGYIVQRVSGERFEDYVKRHILDPLGMFHSTFEQPLPAGMRSQMANGYLLASESSKPFELAPAPAGGLSTTGADMAKFMIAQLAEGRGTGARLFSPATARQMHFTGLRLMAPLTGMALGFVQRDYGGRRVIFHSGDTIVFHSDLNLFIDDHVGIFVSVNSAGPHGAAQHLEAEIFSAFADRYLPGEAVMTRVPRERALQDARLVAGYYRTSRRAQSSFVSILSLLKEMEVRANPDGTITMPPYVDAGGVPVTWEEVAPDLWTERTHKYRMLAKLTDGHVSRLALEPSSGVVILEPVPVWKSGRWLLPLVYSGFTLLTLTVLAWPLVAVFRHAYRIPAPAPSAYVKSLLAVRVASLAVLILTCGWVYTFQALFSGTDGFMSGDGWLRILLVCNWFVLVGGVVVALVRAWHTWATPAQWSSRLWAILLVIAFGAVFYAAATYNMLKIDTEF